MWLLLALIGCNGGDHGGDGVVPDDATVLVIGDSIMAWNREEGSSVAQLMDAQLDQVVGDGAVSGAYFTLESDEFGEEMDIRNQVLDRDWEWVVFAGGGNDLNDECLCDQCDDNMDSLLSEDGSTGAMPTFIDGLNDQGTKVLMFGYMGIPQNAEFGFANCGEELVTLKTRAAAMSESRPDFWFVDGTQLYDGTDLSYYDEDQIHPSLKGSQTIADALADVVRTHSE